MKEVFDSIIVVTDRRILDEQIRDTIKQFAQVGATSGHAENSGDLRKFIEQGKKIIITTVQKFPFILDEIGDRRRGKTLRHHHRRGAFQPGRQDLGGDEHGARRGGAEEEEETDPRTRINRLMEARKMLPNASYFAFTATPKNKTLEMFGEPPPTARARSSTGPSTATR
jgi:type I restriction enzyme R subunit